MRHVSPVTEAGKRQDMDFKALIHSSRPSTPVQMRCAAMLGKFSRKLRDPDLRQTTMLVHVCSAIIIQYLHSHLARARGLQNARLLVSALLHLTGFKLNLT